MLFNGFAEPLRLKRKSSRLLGVYLLGLHGLALLVLCLPLAISYGLHLVLYFLLLMSAIYYVFYYSQQHDNDITTWVWQKGGGWIRNQSTSVVYSLRLRRSLQTPWFVMISLSAQGYKPEHLLILYDQVDADSFRRLRVRLKFYQDEATAFREERE